MNLDSYIPFIIDFQNTLLNYKLSNSILPNPLLLKLSAKSYGYQISSHFVYTLSKTVVFIPKKLSLSLRVTLQDERPKGHGLSSGPVNVSTFGEFPQASRHVHFGEVRVKVLQEMTVCQGCKAFVVPLTEGLLNEILKIHSHIISHN